MKDKIYMAKIGTMWLMGRYSKEHGVDLLYEPHMYVFSAKEHGVMPLPGNPDVVEVKNPEIFYLVTDGEVKELYIRKTSVITVPEVRLV